LNKDIIIYGASGHGKVIMDAITSCGHEVNLFIDDNKAINKFMNRDVIHETHHENTYVIAIGNNTVRKKVAANTSLQFAEPIIHSSAVLSSYVEIEKGTVVLAGAVINSSVKIGSHVIINTSAVVEHDCIIHDFAHISPQATLCGSVEVGQGTQIGAGATVLPNLKIGEWCAIGAGAVVIKDVPDGATVVGNPGRIIKISPCLDS
jgi:acetyltransferase EpsM